MKQNKTSKYLLYAIGEISLVMIGILLALQVNNWNETRKVTAQEVKILSELKNDLEANFVEVNGTYNNTLLRLKSTVLILNYFEDAKPVDDSLKIAFERIQIDGLFNNANTAYEYIKNKGVNILSNDSLRIRITEMYERQFYNIINREANNWNMTNNELIPLMNQYFKTSPPIDTFFPFSLELNMPKDIEILRANDPFKNVIVRLQNFLLLRLNWQKETITSLEKLIKDVQEEIDRLRS